MYEQEADIEIFRDMTVKFLDVEIAPHYESWENAQESPRSLWNTLGQAGLLGIDMPEEYGGGGAPFEICQMITAEMARKGFGGLATGYSVHSNIVMPYILSLGSEEQKQYWIPRMCTGEAVGAIAMTEPGAGSDLASMRTKAVKNEDGWTINGSKTFITNGTHADVTIICAKTNPEKGAKGISLFLVDTSLPGFVKGNKIEKLGLHSNDTTELFFEDLVIPDNALLGSLDQGFIHLMNELPRERLGLAAQSIGAADGAMSLTVEYTKERKAFGTTVSNFQNTRFKLAQLKAQTEVCRTYLERCMHEYSLGKMTNEDAAILKLTSTENLLTVVNECLQLFGGYGYTKEYPISRFYTDARVQTIYGGTSEIMKEVIARSLLGR